MGKANFKGALRATITCIFKKVANIEITGNVNELKAHSGSIITCNHVSYLDGIMLALCSKHYMHFLVETDFSVKNKFSVKLFKCLTWLGYGRVVPMDSASPHSMRRVARLVSSGATVMMFPEGQISCDGNPLPERPGLRWLQQRTGADRYHITIKGAEKSKLFGKLGNEIRPQIEISYPSCAPNKACRVMQEFAGAKNQVS